MIGLEFLKQKWRLDDKIETHLKEGRHALERGNADEGHRACVVSLQRQRARMIREEQRRDRALERAADRATARRPTSSRDQPRRED